MKWRRLDRVWVRRSSPKEKSGGARAAVVCAFEGVVAVFEPAANGRGLWLYAMNDLSVQRSVPVPYKHLKGARSKDFRHMTNRDFTTHGVQLNGFEDVQLVDVDIGP